MSDVVRRVIIQTQIEHTRMKGGASGTGKTGTIHGSSPQAQVKGEKEVTKEKKKQVALSEEERKITAADIRQKKIYNREARKRRLWLDKVRANSQKMEKNRIAQMTKNAKQMERVKRNSLNLEKQITAEIARQNSARKLGDRLRGLSGADRTRAVMAAARKQDGRRGGGGRDNSKLGGGFLETGIPALDFANKIGFQAFITTMTARMVGQFAKAGLSSVAGFSGEGEGLIAQTTRMFSGDPRSKRDPIRNYFVDTIGDIMRAFSGPEAANAGGVGYRGDRLIQQGQDISSRAQQMAQGRMTVAMREEDKLIEKKRELLREEVDAIQQRIKADQDFIRRAMGQRESAEIAFGRATPEKRAQTIDIARRIAQGADISRMSKEDRELIDSGYGRAVFPKLADVTAQNIARGSVGFQRDVLGLRNPNLAGGSILGQEDTAFRDAQRIQAELAPARAELNAALNATLNIERLELDSQGIVDDIQNALAPYFEDLLEDLQKERDDLVKKIKEDMKVGGGVGTVDLGNPQTRPRIPGGFGGR